MAVASAAFSTTSSSESGSIGSRVSTTPLMMSNEAVYLCGDETDDRVEGEGFTPEEGQGEEEEEASADVELPAAAFSASSGMVDSEFS